MESDASLLVEILRFEQDWAYQESLRADQEKARSAAAAAQEKTKMDAEALKQQAADAALQREKADPEQIRAKRLRSLARSPS